MEGDLCDDLRRGLPRSILRKGVAGMVIHPGRRAFLRLSIHYSVEKMKGHACTTQHDAIDTRIHVGAYTCVCVCV